MKLVTTKIKSFFDKKTLITCEYPGEYPGDYYSYFHHFNIRKNKNYYKLVVTSMLQNVRESNQNI